MDQNQKLGSEDRLMEPSHQQKVTRGREIISPGPDCHFLTIAKHGVDVFCVRKLDTSVCENGIQQSNSTIISPEKEVQLERVASWGVPGIEVAEWSPSGDILGVAVDKDGLLLIDPTQNFKEVGKMNSGAVKRMYFSPRGTYAVVLTQFVAAENEQNVKVYKVCDQSVVATFGGKNLLAQDKWPPLVWSSNEHYCFRKGANEVQVFSGDLSTFPTPCTRIPAERVNAFLASVELANNAINVAVFVPSIKDKPACVFVFALGSPTSQPIRLNSKSFFQVQEIRLEWNFLGTAVLATAYTDVDTSGQSYYGRSSLYCIEAARDGLSCQAVGGDKGPIFDSQWSPSADEFLVINGPIPPSINLYNGRTADVKLSFGQSRRNTVRFNPFGRFILMAGFGNLAGDFDVWDKNKRKIIGCGKAPCSVTCEWAPDGRVFLCATTAPRLRVDNCVKVFRYNGDLLAEMDIPDLYFAKWRPCPPGTHPDRGISRGRAVGAQLAQDAPKLYRPPKASEEYDARVRAQWKEESQRIATVVGGPKLPPGAEFIQPVSRSAKKNAARKAKKRREAAAKEALDQNI